MFNTFLLFISIIPFLIYFNKMRKLKLTTKEMVVVALFSAISYMLSLIPVIKYPQDGGINMFSMLPLLLVSILYSRKVGVTAGLITGLLSLLMGGYIVHPAQLILDYLLPEMALGLSDIFGKDSKKNIVIGSLVAVLISTLLHFISGIVFFGQFAPEGMNPVVYSFIYNFSGGGLEGVLSVGIIYMLPIARLKKALN
ncbi:energy-coupled thiamine transporter ThiT [Clostridium paraputrificum]|uniref:energy-coupled thiamine transporter ThiT n=1 Tax=Clostridium TaxID=1485 RepID=UPI003D34C963